MTEKPYLVKWISGMPFTEWAAPTKESKMSAGETKGAVLTGPDEGGSGLSAESFKFSEVVIRQWNPETEEILGNVPPRLPSNIKHHVRLKLKAETDDGRVLDFLIPLAFPDYETAVDEMVALVANQGDLAVRIRRFFVEQPKKLARVVLKPVIATSAMESSVGLEPTELFLKLLAAVRANDSDGIGILEQEAFS